MKNYKIIIKKIKINIYVVWKLKYNRQSNLELISEFKWYDIKKIYFIVYKLKNYILQYISYNENKFLINYA